MIEGPWTPQSKPAKNTRVVVNQDHFPGKYAGVVWLVDKALQVNVELKPESGVGKRLRIRPEYLLPATEENVVKDGKGYTVERTADSVSLIPVYPPLENGTVVKIIAKNYKDGDKLMVVAADNTYKNNTVRLHYLGGSKRYYPSVPRAHVEVVPLEELAAILIEQL